MMMMLLARHVIFSTTDVLLPIYLFCPVCVSINRILAHATPFTNRHYCIHYALDALSSPCFTFNSVNFTSVPIHTWEHTRMLLLLSSISFIHFLHSTDNSVAVISSIAFICHANTLDTSSVLTKVACPLLLLLQIIAILPSSTMQAQIIIINFSQPSLRVTL